MTRRVGGAILVLLLLAGAGYVAFTWVGTEPDAVPEGIVRGNGRIEADQVDIAPRVSGRVERILAGEGEMVEAGALLAVMDSDEIEAALDGARAGVALAEETKAEAAALVAQREAELRLAEHELDRARSLLDRGITPRSAFEQAETARAVARAALVAARASVATASRQITAAEAEVRRLESQLSDSRLTAPVAGRVLYRLAEPGEVVPAGGPILTLLSLEDVYMEIFLSAGDAGRLALGAEARIVLDVLQDYAIPARVSFVSPEAQFTPKQVETLSEREKLVFKTRVRVPSELVVERIAHVKTGMRGVAYVRLDPSVAWPEALERRIPPELFE